MFLDHRDWPVVRFADAPDSISVADVHLLQTEFEKTLERRAHFVMLSDVRNLKLPSADVRAEMRTLQERLMPILGPWIVAEANISTSSVVRGVGAMMNWVARPPYPQRYFADATGALSWLSDTWVKDERTTGTLGFNPAAVG